MAKKTITICDSCKRELAKSVDHFQLGIGVHEHEGSFRFRSLGEWPDPSGGRDRQPNQVEIDLCESCVRSIKDSVEKIARRLSDGPERQEAG